MTDIGEIPLRRLRQVRCFGDALALARVWCQGGQDEIDGLALAILNRKRGVET